LRLTNRIAAVVIGCVVALLVVGYLIVSDKVNHQDDQIQIQLNAGCMRGNAARKQQIRFMLTIADNNRALIVASPPTQVPIRRQFIDEYEALARSVAEPYRSVSLYPSSQDPLKVSQVDCDSQYPLP
jgi:hypothetical protein